MAAGLIQKKAKTPIVISQPTGNYVDGKPTFTTFNALAMLFDMTQRDIEYFGTINNGRIFLISPVAPDPPYTLIAPPEPSAKITCNGETFDIVKVKTYRNLKSELLGYRCAVAGG